jgi:hypothetical protein
MEGHHGLDHGDYLVKHCHAVVANHFQKTSHILTYSVFISSLSSLGSVTWPTSLKGLHLCREWSESFWFTYYTMDLSDFTDSDTPVTGNLSSEIGDKCRIPQLPFPV